MNKCTIKFIRLFAAAVLLTVLQYDLFAQLKPANELYDKMAYSKAIPLYETALKLDSTNLEAWKKLGDCYRLTSQADGAERAYSRVAASSTASPEVVFFYAEALMENAHYEQAKTALKRYQALNPNDGRAAEMINGIDQLSTLRQGEASTGVQKLGINSKYADFCPVFYNGGLVFTSNRPSEDALSAKSTWTGDHYYQLFYTQGKDNSFSDPKPFARDLGIKLNNGPVTFNGAGNLMYFTRNNVENGKVKKDEDGSIKLKILGTRLSNGVFDGEIPFPYNSPKYNVCHPALSFDGNTIYFASDMPGGQGGMDIYKCTWDGNGWSKPENLGKNVNTKGNEVFPFISKLGKLFFASDGWGGFGGLDLYSSDMSAKPENMGAPINSSNDDFGISTDADGMSGYFSSNRVNQKLNDDIYSFKKTCTATSVTVLDGKTKAPLVNTEVKIFQDGKMKESVFTDESGVINRCLVASSSYEYKAEKIQYRPSSVKLSGSELSAGVVDKQLVLEPTSVDITAKVFNRDDKVPVPDQEVVLTNVTTGTTETLKTNGDGMVTKRGLDRECDYEFSATRENCGTAKENFNTRNIEGDKKLTLDIPLLCKGDIIKLDNIYYDYREFKIRIDAAKELDKLVELMNKYPTMKIELRSHTDSRGSDELNLSLSQKRAKSAVDYLISKGIDKKRLVAKGYGEKELVNGCTNDVECTDAEHEKNRRTEFKILNM
jgi:outer membrane protein OmpA-like peptidoglycan-associated protein